MKNFMSLFMANLIVLLGYFFSYSIYDNKSFIEIILLFLWGTSIFIFAILFILILIDNFILEKKKWIELILLETVLLCVIFISSPYYFMGMILLTQLIKYFLYKYYKTKYMEIKNEK